MNPGPTWRKNSLTERWDETRRARGQFPVSRIANRSRLARVVGLWQDARSRAAFAPSNCREAGGTITEERRNVYRIGLRAHFACEKIALSSR